MRNNLYDVSEGKGQPSKIVANVLADGRPDIAIIETNL